MAKNKENKKQLNKEIISENTLPQNILPIGERVEENKNIYISQPVYKQIHKFTKNKTTNESGGMLIGNIVEEFGKINIIVNGFVEAKYCEATPTTLKFTHETWDYCHKEIEEKFPGQKIVGWIHTHPNFGIFLSEYDKFIHENFFNEDYQIAYVVDPIQNIEGFYFWIDGKLTKCNGFYKFDKTGVKIENEVEAKESTSQQKKTEFDFKSVLIGLLAVCVVILFCLNLSQNSKINVLQKKQEDIISFMNQNFMGIQQQISNIQTQFKDDKEPVTSEANTSSTTSERDDKVSSDVSSEDNTSSETAISSDSTTTSSAVSSSSTTTSNPKTNSDVSNGGNA